ncbi:MAG: hypothetical protein L6Q98_11615 [Anaerolineae bacterium]|nr:hypothetical protein [Anaerolineae bacterium]NUQ06946.1 hypothetical protein [Anaerolineae bacterium]
MAEAARSIEIDSRITRSLTGIVFEVRQGYKSKDSKRQNADIANAVSAYTSTYLPCVLVFSTQIDADILLRYRAEKWIMLIGIIGADDPMISTYDFLREIIGYDLGAFFSRVSPLLRTEIDTILKALLSPGNQ